MNTLQSLDIECLLWINQGWASASLDPIMVALSSKGLPVLAYAYFLNKAWQRWGRNMMWPVVIWLLTVGCADALSSKVAKPYFKRVRPCFRQELQVRTPAGPAGSQYGFVSSHAANAWALYTLVPLSLGMRKPERLAWAFLALLISISRVYLGVHFPADVAGGALLGLLLAALVFRLKPGIWNPLTKN